MITTIRRLCNIAFFLLLLIQSNAQELRTFNQNSARSNRGLSVSLSPVYSSAVNNGSDSLLFRGSGAGFRVGADYFFGKAGISFSSGFGSSSPDNTLINNFLSHSSIPPDQLLITKSNQQNMYLLLGPSFQFGNKVQLYAHAKGGLFINNGGLISIQQRGAVRSAYRNESTGKSVYPGFQTGLNFQYSLKSDVWSFGIGADYMSTKTEVMNYDARRGGGVEGLKLSRNISDIVAGVSIRYNIFSARDHSSGQSSGRRVLPTVNKREVASPRDAASGLATGKRHYQPGQPVYGNITREEENEGSCGPVTTKTTNPDGSVEEMTFSCPADAANYNNRMKTDGGMPNRISMNRVSKQTQGATFGEKVKSGVQDHNSSRSNKTSSIVADDTDNKKTFAVPHVLEGKGIISGRLTWPASDASMGIITNNTARGGSATMNSQTSSTRQTNQSSFGTLVRLNARETGSGLATGKRSRDAGSGLATGRRQYEPIFEDGQGEVCNPCLATAKMSGANNNPLYQDKGLAGDNPLYDKRTTDDDCDGIAGADIYLIDAESGAIAARTKTQRCGDFFFANVPEGNYVVRVSAVLSGKKGYDVYLKSKTDLMGSIVQKENPVELFINTGDGNDAMTQKAGISTSRSNIRSKALTIIEADLDGDGEFESLKATGLFSDGTSRDITNGVSAKKVNKIDAFTIKQGVMQMNSGTGSPATTYITGITVAKGDVNGDGAINTSHSNSKNLRATATFSDGSTMDVTGALVANTTHSNVRQYSITVGDLDGDGFAESVRITKSRSNIQNNRVAGGDSDNDGIVWSPRSNLKTMKVATSDVDGDGMPDIVAGNLQTSSASKKSLKEYFENGDIPTQNRPGNPIGGLTIKGGKNPGGNLRIVQTNENGEFEFTGLDEGDYTFTVEQKIFIQDETPVTVGNKSAAQDHNSSRSNKSSSIVADDTDNNDDGLRKGDVKVTASQNTQSLRTIGPDMEPDVYWINKNGNESGNPVTKAQNNNTVRSNRIDNALILNNNNDPDDQSKTKSNSVPVRWTAPESMKTAINNSHSNIKNLLASLDNLDKQLSADQSNARSIVNTSRSNIKNQRAVISNLEQTIDELQTKDKETAMNELEQRRNETDIQFLKLQESVKRLGSQYTSISNVLKTRHEIAMNSIRNLK